MTADNVYLKQEELKVIYKLLKEYEENAPKNEEEYYDDYNDRYKNPIDKKIIRSTLKKIGTQIPQETRKDFDKEFLRKKYHTFNNEINENAYRELERAFRELRTIEINYFSMDSAEFKKRKLDIYHKTRKYIIGYCHLRRGIRKFRTSRIASARITDSPYTIPQNFNKDEY